MAWVRPKGTPPEIVKAIEVAFVKAVEDPEQVKKMNDVGLALKPMVGAGTPSTTPTCTSRQRSTPSGR